MRYRLLTAAMLMLAFALSMDGVSAKTTVGDCAVPPSTRAAVRTADLPQCVPLGKPCILHGTKCCSGECKGPFPNTTCR